MGIAKAISIAESIVLYIPIFLFPPAKHGPRLQLGVAWLGISFVVQMMEI